MPGQQNLEKVEESIIERVYLFTKNELQKQSPREVTHIGRILLVY